MDDGLTRYQRHYRKHRDKHIARAKKRNVEQRKIASAYILAAKNSPCADCGVEYPDKPWRMCYDHLPGTKKEDNIANLVGRGWSLTRIQKEIDKCEVVCLLCHSDRTHTRGLSANGNTSRLQREVEGSIPSGST